MTRSSYRAWCGVIGRVSPKPAALMREVLSETLPVRIATGEIRAYLPVSSGEGMAAGSGTNLEGWVSCHSQHMMTSSNGNIFRVTRLLALCVGKSPVTGEFPAQRPVTRSFDVFFDLRLNKRLSKQSLGWWFETLSCSLWRHRNKMYCSDPVQQSTRGPSQ